MRCKETPRHSEKLQETPRKETRNDKPSFPIFTAHFPEAGRMQLGRCRFQASSTKAGAGLRDGMSDVKLKPV